MTTLSCRGKPLNGTVGVDRGAFELLIGNRARHLYRSYGVVGLIRLALDVIATKISMPSARILRRPFYIRGRRWISLGPGFTAGPGLRIDAFPTAPARDTSWPDMIVTLGREIQVNDYVHIAAIHSIVIGHRVLIGSKVFITDHGHGAYKAGAPQDSPLIPPAERYEPFAPVVIEDDVWIGEFVSILPGVIIGRGSIIGTMSTVTCSIPPFSIAVGSPARVIKQYNFETSTWDPV